jgi:hypothetical protein
MVEQEKEAVAQPERVERFIRTFAIPICGIVTVVWIAFVLWLVWWLV